MSYNQYMFQDANKRIYIWINATTSSSKFLLGKIIDSFSNRGINIVLQGDIEFDTQISIFRVKISCFSCILLLLFCFFRIKLNVIVRKRYHFNNFFLFKYKAHRFAFNRVSSIYSPEFVSLASV
jgi:hypothetical protein